mgnify:CR=1 FL=1
MVNRDLWLELINFHVDIHSVAFKELTTEEKLNRALTLLHDIYRYEHTAEYN